MTSPTQTSWRNLPEELREVVVLQITDPTAAGDSIELVNFDVISLDAEQFSIKRVGVPLDDCYLLYSHTNANLRTRTAVQENFEGLFILGPKARGSIEGAKLQSHDMIAAGPGTQAEVVVDRGYESIALLMPPGIIDRHLTKRGIKKDFSIPDDHEVWHPDSNVASDLFDLGLRIAEAAEESPEIFNNSHFARYGAQVEYLDSLFATIESCDLDDYVDTDKKGKSYSQIVKICEDYTMDLEGRRPYLSELCEAANVSEKTLQNAFREIMGMSPMTYLNRLRLHRARDELRKAKSGTTTVTDVAMNWGFWHFGEFSRAYNNCFGELPSATLKRNFDD